MFPTIDDHKVYDVKLAAADIKAIQKLYGPPTRNRTLTTLNTGKNFKTKYLQFLSVSVVILLILIFNELVIFLFSGLSSQHVTGIFFLIRYLAKEMPEIPIPKIKISELICLII